MLIDVEVVHFIEENLINEFEQMSNDDKRDLTLEDILKLAAICREVCIYSNPYQLSNNQ